MSWPIHPRESARLAALKQYEIMDSSAERAYDELVELAAQLFGVPIAMVVFVDAKRQWFKSKVGMPTAETSREHAFCAYTILDDELFIVPDAKADARFIDNPLVSGDPNIRFYAGAPLISSQGFELGSFCLIDTKPRELDQSQRLILRTLANQVMTLLELRRTTKEMAEALKREAQLRELLPICSYCKNIRDDEGYWQRIESYLNLNAGVELSHGICPDCLNIHFPDEPDES